ncbi:sulfur relay protein DsrC [Solemya pervernicosa gill symbiont]|uniref:Sulfur relay protein DsrC n=2 Tax=Gammaproteobacteria incertae sedis TaxID=118884 RepID=A0A1T2L6I9_9GAMM|nr:sulfur relay protein DsrC [Candidatus Reidiella endopervernicosa]OOZ40701.1 sulfur relay protein DsrC [Solemya pervernicosa gill symbiont]QKQ26765.1 sulfur relay protein DsrC [Candidatus Reidiella endopervernicosa]
MLYLSEVMIQHTELESFEALLEVITARAKGGERFFKIDVKPPYNDTPENWEDRLEAAFT